MENFDGKIVNGEPAAWHTDERTQKYLNAALADNHPSDLVQLDLDAAFNMEKLVLRPKGANSWELQAPSDIIFCNTIPLQDFFVEYDNSSRGEKDIHHYRFMSLKFNQDIVEEARETENWVTAGAMVEYLPYNVKYIWPIVVIPGEDSVVYTGSYTIGFPPEYNRYDEKNGVSLEKDSAMFGAGMALWYSIQIALLHPTVQDVFVNPQRGPMPIGFGSRQHQGKRRPVRYIKRHVINADDVKQRVYVGTGEHKFERRTLVWYVVGHWRHYKDGRIKFIKPYWKGPLRGTKNPKPPREREIVTDGISVDNSTESVHN